MILVLGAGFIGSALTQSLMQRGHRVRVFSRGPAAPPCHEYVQGMLRDVTSFPELFVGVSAVVHCIHTSVPANSNVNLPAEIEGNLLPTLRAVEMMKACGVGTLIYLSSGGAIYGAEPEPVTEDAPTNPISGYGVTKLAMEHYLRLLHRQQALSKLVILRPSNVYGPGQRLTKPQGVIAHMLRAALEGTPFQLWGDGRSVKDYLHVSDLVEAIHRTLALPGDEALTFNVSTGEGYSVLDILGFVEDALGHPLPIKHVPALATDISRIVLDHSSLTAATGWTPRTRLPDGIRQLVEELKPSLC